MYQNKRILLIEDDDIAQKLIVKLCERHGIQVVIADTPAAINQALTEQKFDLFLVDLILPEITGWEAIDLIDKSPNGRDKPIVVLTGAVLSNREKDSILQRAAAVVEKKFFTLKLFDGILTRHLAQFPEEQAKMSIL